VQGAGTGAWEDYISRITVHHLPFLMAEEVWQPLVIKCFGSDVVGHSVLPRPSTPSQFTGWSLGKDDRASAEKEAMNLCSQRGKACVLRTAFNKECGALAADGSVSGWGSSADQREAQQKAIEECKKAGGARCVLHISFCSR
jgi:hypothetical protein